MVSKWRVAYGFSKTFVSSDAFTLSRWKRTRLWLTQGLHTIFSQHLYIPPNLSTEALVDRALVLWVHSEFLCWRMSRSVNLGSPKTCDLCCAVQCVVCACLHFQKLRTLSSSISSHCIFAYVRSILLIFDPLESSYPATRNMTMHNGLHTTTTTT